MQTTCHSVTSMIIIHSVTIRIIISPLGPSDHPRPPVSHIEIPASQAPSAMILTVYNTFTMGISELFSGFTLREVLSQMFEARGHDWQEIQDALHAFIDFEKIDYDDKYHHQEPSDTHVEQDSHDDPFAPRSPKLLSFPEER